MSRHAKQMKRISILLTLVIAMTGTVLDAQSTWEMKRDSQSDLEKADAALNVAYKKALATLSEKGGAALREGQRAWITYRDKTAEAYGTGEEGGSLEGVMVITCATEMTKNRTAELKKLFLSDQ